MATDILIRGGLVVDGTGAEPRSANVLIRGDRIVEVGAVDPPGAQVIDATGKVVTPGFIDVHTHYDPQICWDRLCDPSLKHGVTTVVMGNCSLSLAPVTKDGQRKVIKMFQQIEDFHPEDFEAGVHWEWESFPEYIAFISKGLGINVSPLVGHSTLRFYAMGAASQERVATPEEIEKMANLMKDAMAAGAGGISFSSLDVDEDMRPCPSRFADFAEKVALAKAVATSGRGVMQWVPNFLAVRTQVAAIAELAELSRQSGLTGSFGPVVDVPALPILMQETLRALAMENARGGRVYGQTSPRPFDMNLRLDEASFLLFLLPSWMEVMRLPLEERAEAFANPTLRPRLIFEGLLLVPLLEFATVGEVYSEENEPLRGLRVKDIAIERNQMLPQTLIDIALNDGLRTVFQIQGAWHGDEDAVARLLKHKHIQLGASDAGAHCSQFCGTGDTSYMLSRYVRERGDLTLAEAVHRMTQEPAQTWCITDRGVLKPGAFADVVILDANTVERGEEVPVPDLPGGSSRYTRIPTGFSVVMVNGAVVVQDGEYTQARTGVVVR
jgi:N-acyl-D-aspartate/D-glutamate deacylase